MSLPNPSHFRLCPRFKVHWIEDNKVKSVKRYDYGKAFVVASDIVRIIMTLFPNYRHNIVKFRDGDDLVELSGIGNVFFQFDERFTQLSVFIFYSADDAEKFVPPWITGDASPEAESPTEQQPLMDRATFANHPSSSSTNVDLSRPTTPEVYLRHPNITCDLCQKNICGVRYKCLECPNFDLCEKCHRKSQLHSDHLMLLIPSSFVKTQGPLYRNVVADMVSNVIRGIPCIVD